MYNISIDDDSVVVECRYLRHRRRRHYLRRCFHARTCVRRDQCARSSLSRIFIAVFPLIKLIGYDRPRHAYSRSEVFDVVTKVEGCSPRAIDLDSISVIRFLNELPPLGGISRSPSCAKRQRYDRELDTSQYQPGCTITRREMRLDVTHAAIHAKNQYTTLLGQDSDARGYVSRNSRNHPFRKTTPLKSFERFSLCTCVHTYRHSWLYRSRQSSWSLYVLIASIEFIVRLSDAPCVFMN